MYSDTSTSSTGSPALRHRAPKSSSPRELVREVVRHEAFQRSESPTPAGRRVSGKTREGQNREIGTSLRPNSVLVGPSTSLDGMLGHDNTSEDPHDLAYPSRHFPRASMVDNLVLSLDQLSTAPADPRAFDRNTSRPSRQHTSSHSSISIGDLRSSAKPITSTQAGRTEPGREMKEEDQLATIFGDDEDSRRAKAYAAQRAVITPTLRAKQLNPHRPITRSRSSSNSSSIDLGHLTPFNGRMGAAGNRRSQSFDFGSSQRSKTVLSSDTKLSPPIVSSGTQARSPSKDSASNHTIVRRNSGKSARNVARSAKRRSGTIGTPNLKPAPDSPQPLPTVGTINFDTLDRKPTAEVHIEALSTPRPGFFRRVFGSSRNAGNSTGVPQQLVSPATRPPQDRSISAPDHARPSSPTKLQRVPTKQLADPSHNKENQPVITKKPSSFFRRRKKSMSSNAMPPSLPLSLNSRTVAGDENGASSPVSSLRAFMDPYLLDNNALESKEHKRGSSLQSVQNVHDINTESELSRDVEADLKHTTASRHVRQASAKLPKLRIPGDATGPVNDSVTDECRGDDISPASRLSPRPETESTPISPVSNKDEIGAQSLQNNPTHVMQASLVAATHSESSQSIRMAQPQPQRRQTNQSVTPSVATSEKSVYKSAPTTPVLLEAPSAHPTKSLTPYVHVSHPSISQNPETEDVHRVKGIYDNPDELVGGSPASAWLGEGGIEREKLRQMFMDLFDWSGKSILAAMRSLCSKLVLKGETQQVDRILVAFARRWCECNHNHGFVSVDVVHTISYSILLLNTDLHLADIGQKMTRTQFVRNAMDPIRQAAVDCDGMPPTPSFLNVRSASYGSTSLNPQRSFTDRDARSASALSNRPTERLTREDSNDTETLIGYGGPLVDTPYAGSQGGWELQIEGLLKDVYSSISKDPLPLFGQPQRLGPQSSNNLLGLSSLRRTPSTISKARSDRSRDDIGSKSLGGRFNPKARSRARLGSHQGYGSSRTSLDDGSSAWSPMSSTWSKTSLGKNLASMSVDSFATEQSGGDYQSSIGFANALSQAIIRDEHMDMQSEDGIKAAPLLEDESLELYGAPWAKEGILKHKCHLEGVDKRSKDRNWNDCFAVIEKGWMRLFSFSMTAKSLRHKAKTQKPGAGGVVGGGNWQDNAEEVWKFMLRHTIASSLPPPGYSKQRPYVWALSLPNGAVHLFSVGTPDIVKEFVSTANFWSARLSKEPMTGGVTSMEYGWSDSVINRSFVSSESQHTLPANVGRPSTQMSMRSSIDHGGFRPRLPGDKVHISDWNPPQQSLLPSQLMEVDQIKNLQSYVKNIEDELQRHNELRGPMLMAFSSRHPNSGKAMSNWEKKSSYLLREIVKFGTYIEALKAAQGVKIKVQKMRKEDEDARRDEIAERAFRKVNEERD